MNRNQIARILGVLALALLVTASMAAVYPNQEAQGNIAVIEPDDHHLILVDDTNNLRTFRFLVTGQVFINDEEFTLWDVQPGDRATVTYEMNEDVMLATEIRCQRN